MIPLTSIALTTASSLLIFTESYTKYQPIPTAIGFSILGYQLTTYMIPRVGQSFIKIGLCGKDLSKVNKPIIPETMGIIPAIAYLFIMFFFIPFMFLKYGASVTAIPNSNGVSELDAIGGAGIGNLFPHNKLSSFLSSILCLESMILLGLMDDLFDIRWRHKFFLPAIASIPLLIVYYVDFGVTSVLIPNSIKKYFQLSSNSIDLGIFYYFYMAAVAIFCPNSVNILAGINGLEVGQTIVIALLLLLNDAWYLFMGSTSELSNSSAYSIHSFSACLLIPFLGIALGLFKYNKYPAQVFVGDTWCYFSGMVFAVVGISGHFAKTLMLFFLPQIINFIYSSPQLFGLIDCPRHRLPKFNENDGLLYNSWTEYTNEKPLNVKLVPIMLFLEKLKLINLQKTVKDGKVVIHKSSNLTIINMVIVWTGPIHEGKLCSLIMLLQFVVGFTLLVLRHTLAPMLFGFDNSWSMLNRFY